MGAGVGASDEGLGFLKDEAAAEEELALAPSPPTLPSDFLLSPGMVGYWGEECCLLLCYREDLVLSYSPCHCAVSGAAEILDAK